ncbi:rRNA methyltransferase 1, mitochondrial, partial [Varanus komodoensis]
MASLQSFTFGFCSATRLSFTVHLSSRFRTVPHFSTWGKSPPAEREPPHEVNQTETTSSRVDCQYPQKPLPAEKSSPEQNLRKKFWRIFRTNVAEPSKEEFRSLRNDDFPREKGRSGKKIPSLERTEGSEILFGISPCFLALERSRRSFFQMFLKAKRGSTSPAVEKFSQYAEERGIPVKMVRRTVLDLLCKHGVHQGVCLEVTPLRPIDWKDGLSDEVPCTESQSLWLALEGIKDPMNLGAVLRSAHFLGVDGIVMTRRNSCPLTPVVSKASSGAMEVLDVFHTADLQSFLKLLLIGRENPLPNFLESNRCLPVLVILGYMDAVGTEPASSKT